MVRATLTLRPVADSEVQPPRTPDPGPTHGGTGDIRG